MTLKLKRPPQRATQCCSRSTDITTKAQSQSNPTLKYTVAFEGKENGWSCTCPAYIYRKPGVVDCKHIREIKEGWCGWSSRIGPEQQTHTKKCPRCAGEVEAEPENDV